MLLPALHNCMKHRLALTPSTALCLPAGMSHLACCGMSGCCLDGYLRTTNHDAVPCTCTVLSSSQVLPLKEHASNIQLWLVWGTPLVQPYPSCTPPAPHPHLGRTLQLFPAWLALHYRTPEHSSADYVHGPHLKTPVCCHAMFQPRFQPIFQPTFQASSDSVKIGSDCLCSHVGCAVWGQEAEGLRHRPQGWSLLHLACATGQPDCAALLIKHGAEVQGM